MDIWLRFGDESQREVLPLGVSSHKYQRYALIFLFISQTLRRRKKTISWALTCARHVFIYLIFIFLSSNGYTHYFFP